jgi:ectoine hydroxylase-related dioxygenase (phytanoyl-CoA dioxygenase family)
VEGYLDAVRRDGFVILPQAIERREVDHLLRIVQRLRGERSQASDAQQPFLNRGHDVLYNLQREDLAFTHAFTAQPTVMAILKGLLNDQWYRQIPSDRPNFILRAMAGRSSGPSQLPLHIDAFIPAAGDCCFACQVAIVLEDQTPERGSTLVVPGSHISGRYAEQSALDRAVPLEPRAGDIVIWDGRLWHGALPNRTGASRWSVIATFVRWWIKQNFDIPRSLPQTIYDRLSDDEKAILGYCSMPPRDEWERIDIKAGHDSLRPRVADYA